MIGNENENRVFEPRLGFRLFDEAADGVIRIFDRRFAVRPQQARDAHRALGAKHNMASILSIQEKRVVSNDYVVRFQNRCYQLLPPVWPGQRRGKVVIELRLDGTMAIRFRDHYLKFEEHGGVAGSSAPDPRSLAHWRPTPLKGTTKAGTPRRSPRPLAYSRPTGARVALLRSPILPTARRTIATREATVQPQITRGARDSRDKRTR